MFKRKRALQETAEKGILSKRFKTQALKKNKNQGNFDVKSDKILDFFFVFMYGKASIVQVIVIYFHF